jgi:potassium channel
MTVEGRALITAAERGDLVEIKNLIQKGADINQADYDGRTPAHLASANNHIEIVQYLVGLNASLDMFDRFGRTPLQDALDMGHIKAAQILRMGGATVTNPSLARTLCQAAANADIDALSTVELTGGNLGCSDYDGRTAMHLAASEGRMEVIEWLISRGVRSNPRDRWGGTPLDDAVREGFPIIAALLSSALSK